MLKYFTCPNGEKVEIKQCLKSCPHGKRCLSLNTLALVGAQRKWSGVPSCTQLIGGTREAYLQITEDYACTPDSRMFMILGTKAHKDIENAKHRNTLVEQEVEWLGITGMLDELDIEDDKLVLIDHKTSGSYKVQQALKGDMKDWEMQQNFYRFAYKYEMDRDVDEIYIEAIVRDGSTYMAKKRGINNNSLLIPVKKLPVTIVKQFFERKRDALINALETKTCPPKCSPEENWNSNKCRGYCNVKEFCK